MQFGCIGINYKSARLEIRDRTSFTDVLKMDFFQKMEQLEIDQCMVLSTCNRSEVFFFYDTDDQFQKIKALYLQMFEGVELEQYLFTLAGTEAIAYLFRIAAGLESLVLGEDQILGQVKDALDLSKAMGFSKKEMNKVVREAITCAKKIKTELKISEKPLSVSYVGIQQLEKNCGIAGKHVLVIGSGKMAVLALKYIFEYGATKVTICSRTMDHAYRIQHDFPGLEVVPFDRRYEVMNRSDIVISATSSPHLVIKKEHFLSENPVTFLDLAAPRDIDTRLEDLENVQLFNMDTLQKIVHENQNERIRLVELSKEMIQEAVAGVEEWLLSSRLDPTIRSLQQRCDEIVEDSFEYLNRKIEFSQREQKIVRKVLHASLHRLLREPIEELKQLDSREKQDEYEAIIKDLFQI